MAYPTTAELSHSIYHTPVHTRKSGAVTVLDMHGGARVLKQLAPDMTHEQHAKLAKAHRKAADIHDAAWSATVQKAHKKLTGKEYNPVTDYKTSGVANYDYDEASKEKLRHHARAASDHRVLAHVHNSLAGGLKEDTEEETPFIAKDGGTKLAESAIRAAGVRKLVDIVAPVAEALVDQHGALAWGVAEGEREPALTLRCYNPQSHVVTELEHNQYGRLLGIASLTEDGMVGTTRLSQDTGILETVIALPCLPFGANDHSQASAAIQDAAREHLVAAGYDLEQKNA